MKKIILILLLLSCRERESIIYFDEADRLANQGDSEIIKWEIEDSWKTNDGSRVVIIPFGKTLMPIVMP